jgi:hypothetical protein
MAGHHSCRITLPITGLNCRWKRSSNTECDRRQFSSGALGCYAVELRKASAANRTSSLKREPNKGQIDPNNKASSLRRLRTAWKENEDALPSISTNLTQQQHSANQHDHRTHPSMSPHTNQHGKRTQTKPPTPQACRPRVRASRQRNTNTSTHNDKRNPVVASDVELRKRH